MYALSLLHRTFFYLFIKWLSWQLFCTFLSPQINAVKNEKVENLNQIFTQIQRDVKSISKSVAPQPKKQTQVESQEATRFTAYLKV